MNMNPNAQSFYPSGLNPNATSFYPAGLNPNATPFYPRGIAWYVPFVPLVDIPRPVPPSPSPQSELIFTYELDYYFLDQLP